MKIAQSSLLALAVTAASGFSASSNADFLSTMIEEGKVFGKFNLRYESVQQDNPVDDANALILASNFGFTTGTISGFSATVEVEDNRIVAGVDEYTVGPTGFNLGEYSVVGDPEVTELDQAFIQYKNDAVQARLGRQMIILDDQRFIGHVNWRHDRQTHDAFSIKYSPTEEFSLYAAFIDQRNRIFAEEADINSGDILLNLSYKTPVGKLVGFYYGLSEDDSDLDLDTVGLTFTGATDISDSAKFKYSLQYATQENSAPGRDDFEADFYKIELGIQSGIFTGSFGHEVLGSDDGTYGFATPVALLHKYNGTADLFLGTPASGLVDTYISAAFKLPAKQKISIAYHDFDTDEETQALETLGSEVDVQYTLGFGKGYTFAVKGAFYTADDHAVDTDKVWVWLAKKF